MTKDGSDQVREYVKNNRETLAYILKHSEDQTVRSLALAALIRGGNERDREEVKREIDRIAGEDH